MSNSVQTTLTGESIRQYTDEHLLRELYDDCGFSLQTIATVLKWDHTTVHYYLQQFGMSVVTIENGTRTDGYECWINNHWAILVHRLLAVAEWGFKAVNNSVVHHHNAIPWDNRSSNIQLFERPAHIWDTTLALKLVKISRHYPDLKKLRIIQRRQRIISNWPLTIPNMTFSLAVIVENFYR